MTCITAELGAELPWYREVEIFVSGGVTLAHDHLTFGRSIQIQDREWRQRKVIRGGCIPI